jgi:hypothetical protein
LSVLLGSPKAQIRRSHTQILPFDRITVERHTRVPSSDDSQPVSAPDSHLVFLSVSIKEKEIVLLLNPFWLAFPEKRDAEPFFSLPQRHASPVLIAIRHWLWYHEILCIF